MRYTDLELKYKSDSRTIKKILVMHGINLSSYRGLRQTVKNAFCLTDEQCLEAIKLYNSDIIYTGYSFIFKKDEGIVWTIHINKSIDIRRNSYTPFN